MPHRQWVFTIPKRLRVFFRFDRSLLGKLCRAAWETVRDLYALEVDGTCGIPAMIGAIQTFGDLIHWHSHVHAVVKEGVFTDSGHFVHIPETWKHRAVEIWQDKVFELLLNERKIDQETVAVMRTWRHSGFSVDNSVRIEAKDHAAIYDNIGKNHQNVEKLRKQEMDFYLNANGKIEDRLINEIDHMNENDEVEVVILAEYPKVKQLDKTKHSVEECMIQSKKLVNLKPFKSVRSVLDSAKITISKKI